MTRPAPRRIVRRLVEILDHPKRIVQVEGGHDILGFGPQLHQRRDDAGSEPGNDRARSHQPGHRHGPAERLEILVIHDRDSRDIQDHAGRAG